MADSLYTPTNWQNGKAGNTPINGTGLNKLEQGVLGASAVEVGKNGGAPQFWDSAKNHGPGSIVYAQSGQGFTGAGPTPAVIAQYRGDPDLSVTYPAESPSAGAVFYAFGLGMSGRIVSGGGTYRWKAGRAHPYSGGAIGAFDTTAPGVNAGGSNMHIGFNPHDFSIGVFTGGTSQFQYLTPTWEGLPSGNRWLDGTQRCDGHTPYKIGWVLDVAAAVGLVFLPDRRVIKVAHPLIGSVDARVPFWEGVMATDDGAAVQWTETWADTRAIDPRTRW